MTELAQAVNGGKLIQVSATGSCAYRATGSGVVCCLWPLFHVQYHTADLEHASITKTRQAGQTKLCRSVNV